MFYNPPIILGVIRASRWEIHDQPGYQGFDEGIGGMGLREIVQVIGCFELQHGFLQA